MSLERTLAIIKPDGIQHEKAIRDAIEHGGFTILGDRKVELTNEQVSDLFSDQVGKNTENIKNPIKTIIIFKKVQFYKYSVPFGQFF